MLGTIKRGYLNQSNKKTQRTKQIIHNHQDAGPETSASSISGPNRGSPDPDGLGRKFRLTRPPGARTQTPPRPTPLASGVSSVSPDPSRARAPTPLHPVRTRLPTHGVRTHDVTGAVTPISQQGMVATIPTTLVTVALPLSLCNLTSFTVMYRFTVEKEWGRLTSITIGCLLPL